MKKQMKSLKLNKMTVTALTQKQQNGIVGGATRNGCNIQPIKSKNLHPADSPVTQCICA